MLTRKVVFRLLAMVLVVCGSLPSAHAALVLSDFDVTSGVIAPASGVVFTLDAWTHESAVIEQLDGNRTGSGFLPNGLIDGAGLLISDGPLIVLENAQLRNGLEPFDHPYSVDGLLAEDSAAKYVFGAALLGLFAAARRRSATAQLTAT